ncbi:glycosyltransferase family 4 protein [uncultured Marinobacter sp.]|uniref:glycosyltransferase family 4 protein n=1 Tax=uncultured Marinobacter sp. TaxID=187379 RepID=UPI0025842F7F|nr:glycosyltransferase family 4 protein [uncultured Marinobacter sp.]
MQFLTALADEGIEVTSSSLFDEKYLTELYTKGHRSKVRSLFLYLKRLFILLTVFRYEVLWIEYEVFPYLPAFAERLLKLLGKPYVVDYDDAVFHNYDCSGSPLVRALLGKKIDAVMRNAACVVAGNKYLAARARRAGSYRIELVPTVVDSERYQVGRRVQSKNPVIGWIGSPSTQRYVVDIRVALKNVCDQTGARLLLVGATESVREQLPGVPVDVVRWTEDSEADLVSQMDVGIMPLEDGPWEKGKCGYKLIQYMACGVPVVASPVGVNFEIVNENHCGQLAESLSEWTGDLLRILNSRPLQSEFGMAGRKAVEQKYSLQVQAPVLAGILRSVAQRRGNA